MKRTVVIACLALPGACSIAARLGAQSPPPVRALGKLERVTTDSLSSVAEVVQLPKGAVLVNDPRARQVLLFDSTLSHPIVVADTTSATVNAYGVHRGGTIMRYRSDSALYIDEASLTMFVISPSGRLGRVMAFPQPPAGRSASQMFGGMGIPQQLVTGGDQGPPGFDAQGRLVFYNDPGLHPGTMSLSGTVRGETSSRSAEPQTMPNMYVDSAFIYRVDLATRRIDTVASVHLPKGLLRLRVAGGQLTAIENGFDPLPVIDQWAMLPDGTLAIVRGRDYHIDWLGADGKWRSTAKMPFDWQRVSDERKTQLQDSVIAEWRARREGNAARAAQSAGASATTVDNGGAGRGGNSGSGRGGGGGPPPGGGRGAGVPNIAIPYAPNDIADYVPPFTRGAVRADAEGNVWIRTSTVVNGRPVYDIVDRNGGIVDRVQLPAYRTIGGFGPGVVYLAVKDTTAAVRLERVRIR